MSVDGFIAEAARGFLPVTWDALSRDTGRFGDDRLQDKVDLCKERLFGSVVPIIDEDNYPLRVIDYCGKMVAFELISPGIDYWMNQLIAQTATGTNENDIWTDRAETLRKLAERLAWELRRDEPEILGLLGLSRNSNIPRMGISTVDGDVLLTPNPRQFPRPFAEA